MRYAPPWPVPEVLSLQHFSPVPRRDIIKIPSRGGVSVLHKQIFARVIDNRAGSVGDREVLIKKQRTAEAGAVGILESSLFRIANVLLIEFWPHAVRRGLNNGENIGSRSLVACHETWGGSRSNEDCRCFREHANHHHR